MAILREHRSWHVPYGHVDKPSELLPGAYVHCRRGRGMGAEAGERVQADLEGFECQNQKLAF
jgi:hypothetical protein